MIGCLVEEFIKENFGEEKLKKLNNMHQGGKNNEKGNRLEDRFAVFNFTLASVQLGNVEQCEVLLKQKRPQTLIELIEIWQALSTVHG